MAYRYFICDVFTDQRFGGNQLAVLPDAQGLSDRQMQQIAREFNFAETAFVLPPESGHTRRVRIFTPVAEIPFAGHPNVGTAFALATTGEFGPFHESLSIVFEEKAGLVPITIRRAPGGPMTCELAAPQKVSFGRQFAADLIAAAVSLDPGDMVTETHEAQLVSVGLPFILAEVADRDALARARSNMAGVDRILAEGIRPDIHLYTLCNDEFDIRTRMFAPLDGIPEDPATGSANCALAGLLAHHAPAENGVFRWRIAQGVEMGRPSVLEARAEKRDGRVETIWIGGASVLVSEGMIEVD
ncbi:MAG: PhzF family phenazine biosynthesis protein [Gemmatimonadota bacterium]